MQAKSLTGANLKIYINNRLCGIITKFDYTADVGRRPIFGLDSPFPQELAPGQVTIKGTCEFVRLKLDGGLEGRGITAVDKSILLEKYNKITVIDRQTDTVVFNCNKCTVDNQYLTFAINSTVRGRFSFTGITWTNEASS